MIESVQIFKSPELPESGTWVILKGKDQKLESIIAEISGSVAGVNFGIYQATETTELLKYKNGEVIQKYNGLVTREHLIIWSLQ